MHDELSANLRRATPSDEAVLGRLGAALMKCHHDFDRQRFLAPGEHPERGYGRFLVSQIESADDIVLVAERDGVVVGYVWAGIEPLSWKELRDRAGFIHDILVVPEARGLGLARQLVEAAANWLEGRGVPRVMLWTAQPNTAAQHLFEGLGFRRTMIEMTRETRPAVDPAERGDRADRAPDTGRN